MNQQSQLYRNTNHQKNEISEQADRDNLHNLSAPDMDHLIAPDINYLTSERERYIASDAQRNIWNCFPSKSLKNALVPQSRMTIAEFVEHKFLPERVSLMRYAGRTHYQAMLKHVLTPEEVDRMFRVKRERSKAKLKAIPDWPYMGNLKLCDVMPEHIQGLTSAALDRGYSSQTVTHIRNVIGAVFSHAKREQCYVGDNPAGIVSISKEIPQHRNTLTLAQTREVIGFMQYPERELTLLAVFTDMNIAEVCGLQWKYLNISEQDQFSDGEMIPPGTIAVRKQWYRGQLENVTMGRVRNLPISDQLLQILTSLRTRSKFTSPQDFILTSRLGTPINQTNIIERRLKPIAARLNVPSLSWQVFRRTRKTLELELGIKFENVLTMMFFTALTQTTGEHYKWHCRVPRSRAHSSIY